MCEWCEWYERIPREYVLGGSERRPEMTQMGSERSDRGKTVVGASPGSALAGLLGRKVIGRAVIDFCQQKIIFRDAGCFEL